MIPVLYRIPPFTIFGIDIPAISINSFGLMLGLAAFIGSIILGREMHRRKLKRELAGTITVVALVAGIIGAKLLHLIENWDSFLANPGSAFSPSGLTWYGGFVLGVSSLIIYVRWKNIPVLRFLDSLAVALILAYGIGRVGCHLAGDGDYGIPTTLPWGTIYSHGTVKPSSILKEYFDRNPDEREFWHYDSLRTQLAGVDDLGVPYYRFDETTPCHPTPIYELLLGIAGYFLLVSFWKPNFPDGRLFAAYLMLAATFRFLVEFLRLQPRLAAGLSEAQLFAIAFFVLGLVAFSRMRVSESKGKASR
jgi:phosphatidylglycerol:prolipoprotein diacylglycerol transferase